MRQMVHYALALSIALAPTASIAAETGAHSTPAANPQGHALTLADLGASYGQPAYIVDVNHIRLGSDNLTIETKLAIAEDPKAEQTASLWFQNEIAKAENLNVRYTISHSVVEGENDSVADGRLQLTAAQKLKLRVFQVAKPAYEKLKTSAKALFRPVVQAANRAAAPIQNYLLRSEQRYRVTFAATRFLLNSTVMSISFASDSFLNGTVPLEVAIGAGVAGGTISGLLNYFSRPISGWLETPGQLLHVSDKLLNALTKLFPNVDPSLFEEMVKGTKWMAIEGAFFMFSTTILAATGYPIATSAALFAAKFLATVAGGTISQYSWDAAISRFQNVGNALNEKNPAEKNLVNFKANLAFVLVSMLSVAVSSFSLGDKWWQSYTLLGAMGLVGYKIKKKIYAQMDEKLAASQIVDVSVENTECKNLFSNRKAI